MLGMSSLYAIGMLVIVVRLGWQAWRFDLLNPWVNFDLFLANTLTGVRGSGRNSMILRSRRFVGNSAASSRRAVKLPCSRGEPVRSPL